MSIELADTPVGDAIDALRMPRRRMRQDAELDMTPMIDVTFLLLIFFLVASRPDVQQALQLPEARHGATSSERTSVVVELTESGDPDRPDVLLDKRPLSGDAAAQIAAVRAALGQAGKSTLLIKAERSVLHRHVARIGSAAQTLQGVSVALAITQHE